MVRERVWFQAHLISLALFPHSLSDACGTKHCTSGMEGSLCLGAARAIHYSPFTTDHPPRFAFISAANQKVRDRDVMEVVIHKFKPVPVNFDAP